MGKPNAQQAKPSNPQLPSPRITPDLARRLERLVLTLNSGREAGDLEYAPTDVVRRLVTRAMDEEERRLGIVDAPAPKAKRAK